MEATEQNYRIADQIWATLAKENCTVAQAQEILAYVSRKIPCKSHVQFSIGPSAEVSEQVDALATELAKGLASVRTPE